MPPTPVPAPTPAGAWPLTGRDDQLRQIAAARVDPACPGVVIGGPTGVGRTRLAREACAAAEQAGDLVYWAQGTASSASIPLGAFAALIPDDVRSDEPLELIRRSTERVRVRAAGRHVCVGIDDADLLDPTSAALVLHLATAAGVFVVATVRAGSTPPDAIDSLWKDAGAPRIALRPLSGAAIEQLVQEALGAPVEHSVLRRAADTSGGNPLYARELVLGAIDEGRLTIERGMWRLHRQAVSPSLASIVTRRIGTVTDDERAALELLAVGEPLRLGEVSALADLSALEALELREMIVVDPGRPDSVVRLAQPLYGEVLRSGLPVLRTRALQLTLAQTVGARMPLSPDDALRVARWRLAAGAEVPVELQLPAAGAALHAGDPELARRLGASAAEAGLGLAAVLVLARAHAASGGYEAAEEVLAAAEPEAPGDLDAAAYLGLRIEVLYWGLGRTEQASALLSRALRWSSGPAWQMQLDPWRLVLSGFAVAPEDHAHDHADDHGRDGTAPSAVVEQRSDREAQLARIFRAMAVGHVEEAYAQARAIRPELPLADDLDRYALGLMVMIELEAGQDWADLETYAQRILRDAVRSNDHQSAGVAGFALAVLATARGRYREAERWVAEADGHFAIQDAFGTGFSVRALEVGIATMTGDPAHARETLAQLRGLLGDREPLPTQAGYLARAEGWAARALSPAAGADTFLRGAAATDQPLLGSRLLYEALRCGAPPAVVAQQLALRADRCDARLTAAYLAHAQALATRDGAALEAVAEQLAQIGADAYAMEAAGDAARRFVADGRMDSARRAAHRARALHPSGQGTETPVVDGLDSLAIELTPREAQIAALAARGLTNQEIADELVLSVRTVETYVYRAMQKRGVDHRRAL